MLETVDRVLTGIQKIREVARKRRDAEMEITIADLIKDCADLKRQMAELQNERTQLQSEVHALQTREDLRSKLKFRDGLYYLVEPPNGYHQGPYCSRCWDYDDKLVSLVGPGRQPGEPGGPGVIRVGSGAIWTCQHCRRIGRAN